MDLGIVSAASFEIAALEQRLDKSQISYNSFECGIGPITAAKRASALKEFATNKDILFIGTCGEFAGFVSPRLFVVTSVSWMCLAERIGEAYAIKNLYPTMTLPYPHPLFADLPRRKVLCAASISKTARLPEHFAVDEYVENVELYPIAKEMTELARSLTVLLCSTNALNEQAHEYWLKNKDIAAQITADYVANALEKRGR